MRSGSARPVNPERLRSFQADAASYSGTVLGGGAAYYKLSVPANGSATVTLGGQSASAGSHMQFVVVRTQ